MGVKNYTKVCNYFQLIPLKMLHMNIISAVHWYLDLGFGENHQNPHLLTIFRWTVLHRYLLDLNNFGCSEKLWSQFVHFRGRWLENLPLWYQKPSMKLDEFHKNPSAPPYLCFTGPFEISAQLLREKVGSVGHRSGSRGSLTLKDTHPGGGGGGTHFGGH